MKVKKIKSYFITDRGTVIEEKTYGNEGKTLEMIGVGNLLFWNIR